MGILVIKVQVINMKIFEMKFGTQSIYLLSSILVDPKARE